MGVPMVQKQVKRRTSLILGAVLALLLGVAAGFLILALPIAMLETLTTSIGLSRLMIQAEPPISPNDRTVLAVLAAIMTSGIGWVLVDWLLFGRVGMTTLIKPREDEYEDDDDVYRPTDPLDLITSIDPAAPEWNGPAASGDARRPLSARIDIGDPPAPFTTPVPTPDFAYPTSDQSLPPINQILPGMSPILPVPAAETAVAPAQTSPIFMDPFGAPFAPAAPASPSTSFDSSLLATDPPSNDPVAPSPQHRAVAGVPSWLPSPGVRPEEPAEERLAEQIISPPLPPETIEAPAPPIERMPISPPAFPPAFAPPLGPQPMMKAAAPDDFFGIMPGTPPLSMPEPLAPPQSAPAFAPPSISQAVEPPPTVLPPRPVAPSPTPAPYVPAPPPLPVAQPSPVFAAPAPAPAPVTATSPASSLLAGSAPLDRVMIDDLLTRLERGMRNRRASTGTGLPSPAAPLQTAAPIPVQQQTTPAYAPPSAGYAAPQPWPQTDEPIVRRPPPAGFAMNDVPLAPPPVTPLYVPPVAQAPTATPGSFEVPAADGDRMIDQPLHTTLEQLRSMVRR